MDARPALRTAFSPVGYRTVNYAVVVGLGEVGIAFLSILALGGVRPAALIYPDAAYSWAWIGPIAIRAIGLSLGTLAVFVELIVMALDSVTDE